MSSWPQSFGHTSNLQRALTLLTSWPRTTSVSALVTTRPIQPPSTGVNFFAHNPRYDDRGGEENCYCFPPIFFIGPAIQHLLSSKAKATVIIPDLIPRPYWWPMLRRSANKRYLLAKKGKHEVLLWPSKCHGFHQPRLW